MKHLTLLIKLVKPWIPLIIIFGVLKLTGQLGNAISLGQSAVLKTGILNADAESQESDDFDFGFSAYSLNGDPLNSDSLKNKVIFLNIWATWCGPCRAELPTIQNLYNSIDNNNIAFVMLAVDRADPFKRVKQYVDNSEYTFPVYILKGEPTDQIRVPTIPTTFVISRNGKILTQESGLRNYDTNKFRKFLLREANRK